MTSRWVVDIAADRNLDITWRSISLLIKNDVKPDSRWYAQSAFTHGLLRVLESVRVTEGNERIGDLYTAYGRRIHHDQNLAFDPAEALAEAGLPTAHAKAKDDESFDDIIRAHMTGGLALTGNDVGTPILGFTNPLGNRVGFFGPVISRPLGRGDALNLWDGIMLTAGIDSFWELKRTRTESPQFGERP